MRLVLAVLVLAGCASPIEGRWAGHINVTDPANQTTAYGSELALVGGDVVGHGESAGGSVLRIDGTYASDGLSALTFNFDGRGLAAEGRIAARSDGQPGVEGVFTIYATSGGAKARFGSADLRLGP